MSLQSSLKPIVHIATDEKFIDAAYEIYEKAFPGKNRFLILLNEDQDEVKHLSESIPYEFIETGDELTERVKKRARNASLVIFHEMNNHQTKIALSVIEEGITVGWTVFGYEVYSNPYLFNNEIYGKKTNKRFVKSYKSILKDKLRPYYYRLIKRQKDPFEQKIQAMEQMDFVGILYQEELGLYEGRMNFKDTLQHLKFTYYPLDTVIDKEKSVQDNNILLGNSASYSNNHLEVFDVLIGLNIEDRQIICPLSYGNKEYGTAIEKEGTRIFGSNFDALTDFLPLNKYQEILKSCGIVIMNHYRQQAVGNVLNTMYMGSKVFLSKKNTLYHYLKRIGCYVYCVEDDLKPSNKNVFNLLNEEQIKHNRKILKEELSLERVCAELQQKLSPCIKKN